MAPELTMGFEAGGSKIHRGPQGPRGPRNPSLEADGDPGPEVDLLSGAQNPKQHRILLLLIYRGHMRILIPAEFMPAKQFLRLWNRQKHVHPEVARVPQAGR